MRGRVRGMPPTSTTGFRCGRGAAHDGWGLARARAPLTLRRSGKAIRQGEARENRRGKVVEEAIFAGGILRGLETDVSDVYNARAQMVTERVDGERYGTTTESGCFRVRSVTVQSGSGHAAEDLAIFKVAPTAAEMVHPLVRPSLKQGMQDMHCIMMSVLY